MSVFTYRATHIMLATGEKRILHRHNRAQRVAAAKQLLVPSATSDSASLNVKVFDFNYNSQPYSVCCVYTVSQKKLCQCYFVNNSVKHWPNLIIFGMQHRKET